MELSFEHDPGRQFYALRFEAGAFESVPRLRELRFWGVDRTPCPRLSTLAALITLGSHPMRAVSLRDVAMNPSLCTAMAQHFALEIYPATYDVDHRPLAGGNKTVAPLRFAALARHAPPLGATEVLTWTSLDDLNGALGGRIRTNIDAFDLGEAEKNLVVALCAAGKDLGHILLDGLDPGLTRLLHRIGLEHVPLATAP